ncbi:FecR family protein [Pedobacter aquatilis]|uniref:FecR family protein n=1 Tax=Pedobacter aquatilis TaxID=351343 RepID=UPI00292FF0BD|nr:FecR domain-containing protein [Pedobacter aquatilis]
MKEEIWNHIIKRLTQTETAISKSELDNWLLESSGNQKKYEECALLWQLTGKLKPDEALDIPKLKPEIKSINPRPKLNLYWYGGIAAACLVVIFVLVFNFSKNNTAPATEWISKTAGRGKMLSVTLPDSSNVMLNSGTSIRYQKDFAKKETRTIQLSGEAFFEVTHREKQPFVVESGRVKTVVYGTSFNVRAYKNERHIQVNVKSGKVGVLKTADKAQPIFLLPNKRLTFDTSTNAFSPIASTTNAADNWKSGTMIFEQTPIMEVLEALSRRFDVKFDTSDYHNSSCKLTARFERKDLPAILKTIQTVMNIEINQINQTIYLKGGNTCK